LRLVLIEHALKHVVAQLRSKFLLYKPVVQLILVQGVLAHREVNPVAFLLELVVVNKLAAVAAIDFIKDVTLR
jgi:hypothetical protein